MAVLNLEARGLILIGFMILSCILIIVGSLYLEGLISLRPKHVSPTTTEPPTTTPKGNGKSRGSMSRAISEGDNNQHYPYMQSIGYVAYTDSTMVFDINISCCSAVILIALIQFIICICLYKKCMKNKGWAIAEGIFFIVLFIVFGLAIGYELAVADNYLLEERARNHYQKIKLDHSNGRQEAFLAFLGINAIIILPAIVYFIGWMDSEK